MTIVGTAGGYPVGKFEFESSDGGDSWTVFDKTEICLNSGTVYQQQTKTLNLWLTM